MEEMDNFLEIKLEVSEDAIHVKKEVQLDEPANSKSRLTTDLPKAYGHQGKVYDAQTREVIANVFDFMKKEAMNPFPLIPLKNYTTRAIAATKVSRSSLRRICKEGEAVQCGDKLKFSTPGKLRHRQRPRTNISEDQLELIRNIVHRFHIIEKRKPTVAGILKRVREADIGFEGGLTSMRTVLSRVGFTWQKTNDNGKVLLESDDIRLKRTKYLRAISKFRAEGRPIVYADETDLNSTHSTSGLKTSISKEKRLTVVHAGSEAGFIPNGLLIFSPGSKTGYYQDDMNPEYFMNWVKTQLIPNLPSNSVLVLDNASYHNVKLNEQPTKATKKKDMIEWLRKNNILFDEHLTRPELNELIIKNNKNAITEFKLDVLLQQHGHDVLRLPPHHPELNPIKKIWTLMKDCVAARKDVFKLSEVEAVGRTKLSEITADKWSSICNHIKKLEEDYLKNEVCIDEVMDGCEFLSDDDNDFSSDEESVVEPSDE